MLATTKYKKPALDMRTKSNFTGTLNPPVGTHRLNNMILNNPLGFLSLLYGCQCFCVSLFHFKYDLKCKQVKDMNQTLLPLNTPKISPPSFFLKDFYHLWKNILLYTYNYICIHKYTHLSVYKCLYTSYINKINSTSLQYITVYLF